MLETKPVLDTEPTSGHKCYMCGGPGTVRIHDARGCVVACDTHLTWRMQRRSVPGHDHECYKSNPTEGVAPTNNSVR